MRGLPLVFLLLGCSEPVLDGVAASEQPVTVITIGCNDDDLRLWDSTSFTGTLLCLRGTGDFTLVKRYLPNGVHSYRAGIYNGTFKDPTPSENYFHCNAQSVVSTTIQNATTVTPSPPPIVTHCP
jgi:hypothetical protein